MMNLIQKREFRRVPPHGRADIDRMCGMAPKKGTGGRPPLSADEDRRPLLARVPESAFDGIDEVIEGLGVSRSDFATFAAVTVANEFRSKRGLPLITMPGYVANAMDQATTKTHSVQEALLEAS